MSYALGSENQDLPGYVVLFDAGPLGGAGNYSNGFLPAAFQPTRLRDKGTPVLDLLPPEEFATGQRASLDLIRDLEDGRCQMDWANLEPLVALAGGARA